MTVKRLQIVKKAANASGLSRPEAARVLEAFLEVVSESLQKQRAVKLPPLGNFTTHTKKARIGRNPKTRELAIIPTRTVVRFKPSTSLRKQLNKSGG